MKPVAWVVAVAVIVVVVALAAVWWINGRTSEASPSWLFSHTSEGGSLVDNGDGTFTLSLTGADRHVLAFTDRPARDAVIIDAPGLVGMWPELFSGSRPNAVLVEHGDGEVGSVALTLSAPTWADGGLTFTATPLASAVPANLVRVGGELSAVGPWDFSAVSLFIDSATVSSDCVEGVACTSPVERGILCDLGYTDGCPG